MSRWYVVKAGVWYARGVAWDDLTARLHLLSTQRQNKACRMRREPACKLAQAVKGRIVRLVPRQTASRPRLLGPLADIRRHA